jgi:hypothetical protein
MSDADNFKDQGLTTEQIAAASAGPAREGAPAQASYPSYEHGNAASAGTDSTAVGNVDRAAPYAGDGAATASESRASLLDDDELQGLTMRWKDIQAEFVDEPTTAVREADALVAELMQRLAAMFATERAGLEARWAGGNEVSTEELRQGLRLYRSFFERLLAA